MNGGLIFSLRAELRSLKFRGFLNDSHGHQTRLQSHAILFLKSNWIDETIFTQNKGDKLQISAEKMKLTEAKKATNVIVSISDT